MIAPQAADLLGGETLAVRRLPPLTIENAGDDRVRVMRRQATQEGHSLFPGRYRRARPVVGPCT